MMRKIENNRAFLDYNGIQIELSFEVLEHLISYLPSAKKSSQSTLFNLLAKHNSSSVRTSVAARDDLDSEVYRLLATDIDPSVRNSIACNRQASAHLSVELITKLIETSSETAVSVARNVELYEEINIVELSTMLSLAEDPIVRKALAENSSCPKKILKSLVKDSDPSVSNAAAYTLSY